MANTGRTCAVYKLGRLARAQFSIAFCFSIFSLSACKGLSAVDSFTSNQVAGTIDAADSKALISDKDAYDMGPAFSEDPPKTATIVFTNSSQKVLYLKSISASQSANFSITRHTCPITPTALIQKDTCTVTVQFKPNEDGNLSLKLNAIYGLSPGEDSFTKSVDVVGVGVKPLVFSGLTPVNSATVSTTKATLSWPAVDRASSYALYDMTTTPTMLATIQASQTSYQLTGLTPATSYIFRVKAVNVLGYEDTNHVDRTVTTDSIGSFSALPALNVNEGGTQSTVSLASYCTDLEGNTPSLITLTSQSDPTANCTLLAGPYRVQCSPGHKTGQSNWSATVSLSCFLNDNPAALTQTLNVAVGNTNRAPTIAGIPNQTVTAGSAISTVTPLAADPDGDGLTYSCRYDTLIDGAVSSSASNCSTLTNYDGSLASFNTSSGALAWTPPLSAASQSYEFKITVDDPYGLYASQIFTVSVSPAPASTSQSTIAVSSSTVNSGSSVNVTLTAKDLSGTRLPYGGATVVFSNTGGVSTGTWSSTTDNGDGTYSAVFTGVISGSATTLRATINGSAVSSTLPTVTVNPGVISPAQSQISVASGTVSSGSSIGVTLTARDAAGNRITSGGSTILFTRMGGTSTGTFGAVTDNGDGTYTAAFTGATAGTATSIRATVNGVSVTTASPTVTVVPGAVSPAQSTVAVASPFVASGASTTVTLTAKDASGNATGQTGLVVAFGISGGASSGTFSAVTDNGDGTYSAVFTGGTAGTAATVTAAIGASTVTSTLPTLQVTPGSLSLTQSVITVSNSSVASGAAVTVTLQARDNAGNNLTTGGSVVVFSQTGGTSTGVFSSASDNNNGTYTATFTGVIAGTATTIAATVGGATVAGTMPTITVTTGAASPSNSLIQVSNNSVASGSSLTLTLRARDASGNNLTTGGSTVAFSFSGGTSTGTIGATTDVGDGTYTATFTGVISGSAVGITATLNGVPVSTSSPLVTVNPGTLSLAQSSIVASASTVASGSMLTFTATLRDAAGNQLSSGGQTVTFSHSGGSATGSFSLATDNANGTYTASFTGETAGLPTTVRASVGGLPLTSSGISVTVNPGPATATTSTVAASASSIASGMTATVTVQLKDLWGNNVTDGGATVAVSRMDGTSTGTFSAVTDHANGTYSSIFTGVAAGSATTIHSSINGTAIPPANLTTITVTPGTLSLAQSSITASSSTVASGSAINLTLTARDAAGNTITGGGHTVVFSRSGGSSTGTFTAVGDNLNGTYATTFTGLVAGTATDISATINGAALTSAPTSVQVVAGGISATQSIVSASSNSVGAGAQVTVTLSARDAQGNAITSGGATVAFTKGGGTSDGSFSATSDTGTGIYTATFTASSPGTAITVGATINGTTVTSSPLPQITVIPGGISASQSVITVSAATVSQQGSVTITFQGKDSNGNNIASGGANVAFYHTGGTSTGTISAAVDNGNGTYTATFTGVNAGTATSIGATVGGAIITSTLPTVTVLALPVLSSVTNRTFASGSPLVIGTTLNVDIDNTVTNSDTGMSYDCTFDRVLDDVVSSGTNCTSLPGTASFNATTGVLSWVPNSGAWGHYEIRYAGTNNAGSHTRLQRINIRGDYPTTNLVADYDAQYALGSQFPARNSPFDTTWINLGSLGASADGYLSSGFYGATVSGWSGAGTQASPYALTLKGTDDTVDLGSGIDTSGDFMASGWFKPGDVSASSGGKVLFSTGGESGTGISVSMSDVAKGRLAVFAQGLNADLNSLSASRIAQLDFSASVSGTTMDVDSISGRSLVRSGSNLGQSSTAPIPSRSVQRGLKASTCCGDASTQGGVVASLPSNLTMETWILTSVTENPGYIASFGNSHRLLITSAGQIQFKVTTPSSGTATATSTNSFRDGNWHHVVAVQNGATSTTLGGGLYLYVNGELEASNTNSLPITGVTSATYGASLFSNISPERNFYGTVDEAIYYDVAMTAAQALERYQTTAWTCLSRTVMNTSSWYHVGLHYNSSTRLLSLYVNGVAECRRTLPSGYSPVASRNFTIGARPLGSSSFSSYWSGSVADFKVHTSGTESDLTTIYNATKGRFAGH